MNHVSLRSLLPVLLLALAAAGLPACGDAARGGDDEDNNASSNNASSNNSAGNNSPANNNPANNNPVAAEVAPFLAVGTDYETSEVVLIHPATGEVTSLGTYSGDTVVTSVRGASEVAVIDRAASSLEIYSLTDAGATLDVEIALVEGENPYDVKRAEGGALFVARYGSSSVLVLPSGEGDAVAVELSGLTADTDGIPEMSALFDSGDGKMRVVLQGLESFVPAGDGVIAAVDVETLEVDAAATLILPGQNPFFAAGHEGRLLVGLVGAFGALDGQGVAVDFGAAEPVEVLFTEEALGGDIVGFAPVTGGWLVTVATPAFTTELVLVSAGGEVSTVYASAGYDLGAPALDASGAFVLVPDASAGVRAYAVEAPSHEAAQLFTGGTLPLRGVAP